MKQGSFLQVFFTLFFSTDKKSFQPLFFFSFMPLTRNRVILQRQGSYFLFEFTFLELTNKIAPAKQNWSLFAHLIPALRMIYRNSSLGTSYCLSCSTHCCYSEQNAPVPSCPGCIETNKSMQWLFHDHLVTSLCSSLANTHK